MFSISPSSHDLNGLIGDFKLAVDVGGCFSVLMSWRLVQGVTRLHRYWFVYGLPLLHLGHSLLELKHHASFATLILASYLMFNIHPFSLISHPDQDCVSTPTPPCTNPSLLSFQHEPHCDLDSTVQF